MSAERIDFAAEGLLDGLEGEEREERVALLERFSADGVPLEELRRRTADGTLMFVPADRVIAGEERYTLTQIAELSGVELDFLIAVRRAMGLPVAEAEEPVYSDIELQAAGLILRGREAGVSDQETLELVRVLGRALSQVAESLRQLPLKRALEPGISEYELARRYAQSVAQLHPLVAPLLANSLTLHLRTAAQSEVISAMERSGGRLPGSRGARRPARPTAGRMQGSAACAGPATRWPCSDRGGCLPRHRSVPPAPRSGRRTPPAVVAPGTVPVGTYRSGRGRALPHPPR